MLSGPDRGRGFEMVSELIIFRIEFPIEGRQGKIMGWGGTIDKGNVTVEDTKVQCDLLEANTKVLFQSNGNVFYDCNTQVDQGSDLPPGGNRRCPIESKTKFCAHHEDGPSAQICFGDDGGPLIMDQGGFGVVVGVGTHFQSPKCSSGDLKCLRDVRCNKEGVALFTKVFSKENMFWIKKITGEGSY